MCTIFCSRIFLGRYKEVQGGIPFDETCKQSLGRGGAKVEGTICKQLLSSLKAKFSSFIYFRFLIIISSSFFLFCILFHVCSCLCVCNIFVCLHLLRILMNLLLICVRYICRLHWPHGVLVLLPAPVHDSARSSSSDSRDSFVADICRCFCEICASLLIKNCVYLHICIPCHAPHSPSLYIEPAFEFGQCLFVVCCTVLKCRHLLEDSPRLSFAFAASARLDASRGPRFN